MNKYIAARSLALVAMAGLSGCAVLTSQEPSVFSPTPIYDFSEEVYGTSLFNDTTETASLAEKYGPEWELILNKIREYEELLESR